MTYNQLPSNTPLVETQEARLRRVAEGRLLLIIGGVRKVEDAYTVQFPHLSILPESNNLGNSTSISPDYARSHVEDAYSDAA